MTAAEPGWIETFADVLVRLEDNGIPYMVVGSIASIYYGEPRLTRDMDVVVELSAQDAGRLEKLFPEDRYYCPPIEILSSEIAERGQFNLISQASSLKVDLIVRKDSAHGREEFARRRRIKLWKGTEAWIASPEDVILKKLVYYREGESEKHLRDIRGILASTAPGEIDLAYLHAWVGKLGLDSVAGLVPLPHPDAANG